LSYFPALLDLSNANILIVGGGKIATDKLEKLLDFTTNITIIATNISSKMKILIDKYNLKSTIKQYEPKDLSNISIVVVAVDNIPLQKDIFEQCKKNNCLCNSVDSTKYCNFIFPSYIKKDDLTIAISTNGTSPAFAKYFKRFLLDIIPDNIGTFLTNMKNKRTTMPKGAKRMEFFANEAKQYIKSWEIKNETK